VRQVQDVKEHHEGLVLDAGPPRPSDLDLFDSSQSDPEAFGVLYDRYEHRVIAYFMKRTACPQVSADLTAETFAQALSSQSRFKPGLGSFGQWLFGIAAHQLSHYLRKERAEDRARRRLGLLRVDLDDEAIGRIESLVDFSGLKAGLREAMADLPSDQGNALRLRIGLDLPYAEVADRLGCSVGAARVRVSRALATMRYRFPTEGGLE
jgi:RNA polymerase sigma factor (sigma-70 family)